MAPNPNETSIPALSLLDSTQEKESKRPEGRKRNYIHGLDSIRFLAAIWVVFSHFGFFPLSEQLESSTGGIKVLVGIYHCLFGGISAVMVFFLISGIVIHAPHLDGSTPHLSSFLTRRYFRILIPLLVAYLCQYLFKIHGLESVVWSLYAELIYYTIYPGLLRIRRRAGWTPLLVLSCMVTITLLILFPKATYPSLFSATGAWALCLPVWLMGCVLVEKWNTSNFAIKSSEHRWKLRAVIWILSIAMVIMHFHFAIPYARTVVPFGFIAALWLIGEMYFYNATSAKANPVLEWAGTWSYSLYLMHPLIGSGWVKLGFTHKTILWYLLLIFTTFCLSYLFFVLVEKPSHNLVRWLSSRLGKKVKQAAH